MYVGFGRVIYINRYSLRFSECIRATSRISGVVESGVMPNHLATDRLVWTYVPNGHPAGVVTGFRDEEGGVVVEHVIRWPQSRSRGLLAMLGAAWEEVCRLEAPYAVFLIRDKNRRLESLALKMGFEPYAETPDGRWFVRYRAWIQ